LPATRNAHAVNPIASPAQFPGFNRSFDGERSAFGCEPFMVVAKQNLAQHKGTHSNVFFLTDDEAWFKRSLREYPQKGVNIYTMFGHDNPFRTEAPMTDEMYILLASLTIASECEGMVGNPSSNLVKLIRARSCPGFEYRAFGSEGEGCTPHFTTTEQARKQEDIDAALKAFDALPPGGHMKAQIKGCEEAKALQFKTTKDCESYV
jgi:hypothetical protein